MKSLSFLARASVFVAILCAAAASFAEPPTLNALFSLSLARAADGNLAVNPAAAGQLAGGLPKARVPLPLLSGTSAVFELAPMPVFAPDAQVVLMKDNDTSESITPPRLATYFGRNIDNPAQTVFLSASEGGEITALVSGDGQSSDTVISPAGAGGRHRMQYAEPIPQKFCDNDGFIGASQHAAPSLSNLQTRDDGLTRVAEVFFDAGFTLYEQLGSDHAATSAYMTNLVGAVSAIYLRDINTRLVIKELVIWTTLEPFADSSSTISQLNGYASYFSNNRPSQPRDMAHYVSYNPGLGGVAFLGSLCSIFDGYGVSNIRGDIPFPTTITPNTFYWDVYVLTHEIGHGFNSQHTHCYDPPIDCCFVLEACSHCTGASVPAAGTIMSYCHLLFPSGASVTLNFHPRVIDVMRLAAINAPCVSIYSAEPAIAITGKNDEDVPNDQPSPSAVNGTDFGANVLGAAAKTQQFVIRNDGDSALIFSSTPPITATGSAAFSVLQPPATIAPYSSATFEVTLDPAAAGDHEAEISIASNAALIPAYTFTVGAYVAAGGPPQTFTFDGAATIPDGVSGGVNIDIPVSGMTDSILDLDFRINGTNCIGPDGVGIEHPWAGDVIIKIISPALTETVVLNESQAASADNFCNTLLDDESAGPSITEIGTGDGQLNAPFTGSFTPRNPLSIFDGEDPNGTWTINVSDRGTPDQGTVRSLSLIITPELSSGTADWNLYK